MTRKFISAVILTTVCVGFAPTQAAPVTSSAYTVKGTVSETCPTTFTATGTVRVTTNSGGAFSNNPTPFQVPVPTCNKASLLKVKLTSKAMTSATGGDVANYTATATTWGSNPFVRTTDALVTTNGTYTGAEVQRTGPLAAVNLTITPSAYTSLSNGNKGLNSNTYSASVTVTVTVAP